jgi:exonuclease SbcC
MRIERIVARAFGPFQGKTLHLGRGLTVVAGPNESGKSSWHAAMRLAISGVRRGKGPGTSAERQLAERHRPWDHADRWEVEARLALDDGRTIDISQDLAGKVACRAVDVELGRDVSDEIMDGTPDASRWLGLDRDSFAATVSVSQAQILAVADAADQLQEQMQRAAATRGTDATAAEAIARLAQFRRDAVGADTVAAKGPLRTGRTRLAVAEAALAEARRLHSEYLERSAALDEAERHAAEARHRLAGAEAAHARKLAAEAAARAARARDLAARHPVPPRSLAVRDEQADRVAAALESWVTRPAAVPLAGRTSVAIQAEIDGLPAAPTGDTRLHATVVEAMRAVELTTQSISLLGERPTMPEPQADGWNAGQLRDLARRLRTPQLPQAVALEAELARLRSAAAPPVRSPLALAMAGIGLLAAAVLFTSGATVIAATVLAVGIGTAALLAVRGPGSSSRGARIGRAEAALAPYRQASAEAAQERAEAESLAHAQGLPADPGALDDLADQLLANTHQAAAAADWDRRLAGLRARQVAATDALRRALLDRGEAITDSDDPLAATRAYQLSCESRAAQAAASERAETLRVELRAQQAAEAALSATRTRIDATMAGMRTIAAELGLVADLEPERLAAELQAWRERRGADLQQSQQALAEWQQLQSLLGGGTLAELEDEASRRRQRANELAVDLPAGTVSIPNVDDPEAHLAVLRAEDQRLRREYDQAAGSLSASRDGMPDVAEAEESVAAARRDLDRVEALAATVDATLRLLRAAEERVHRDLAPILAQAVARWLPVVSRGAYTEISVDPADLNVRVKEAASGQWRNARLLSEGTREQIYLLLRVAMAEHLVTTGERAPLLLDEVTAQSDGERKRQLLDVLHHLSTQRQVVLFTHDDDVVAWAEAELREPDDALVRLEAHSRAAAAPPVPAPATDLTPIAVAD